MSFITSEVNHATQLDLSVAGNPVLTLTEDGVERTGLDLSWHIDLLGSNFCVAGGGAVNEAVLSIGSFRKYNAWEFPNGSTDPYIDVNFWLPPGYDGRDIKVTLAFVRTATATGSNIVTNARFMCIGAGDSLQGTVSNAINVTTAIGAQQCLFYATHSTINPNNAPDGGMCHGLIQRLVTNVADDYTGSVYLIGARVEFA